jgi:hypothetical protein
MGSGGGGEVARSSSCRVGDQRREWSCWAVGADPGQPLLGHQVAYGLLAAVCPPPLLLRYEAHNGTGLCCACAMMEPPRVCFRDSRLASRKAEEVGTTDLVTSYPLSDFPSCLRCPVAPGIGRFVSLLGVVCGYVRVVSG